MSESVSDAINYLSDECRALGHMIDDRLAKEVPFQPFVHEYQVKKLAIEALKKQIPIEPSLYKLQSGKMLPYCPKCDCEIKPFQDYCLRCGQKILKEVE